MDQGPEKASELLSLRVTARQKETVLRRARIERRSLSEWMRLRLERCLVEEPEPEPYPPPARGNR